MDVCIVLEKRDGATGEWAPDGPAQQFFDEDLWRGHIRARRLGEQWVAASPDEHRCTVWPSSVA